MGYLKKYYSLPKNERLLFLEALRRIYWAKFGLLIYKFKRLAVSYKNQGSVQEINEVEILEIKRAIFRANKLVFWKHTCLVNTLAARRMLNNRNVRSSAYLGVKKQKEELIAHAWLKVKNAEIIPKEEDFTELHEF